MMNSSDIGIDLGTASILVYLRGKAAIQTWLDSADYQKFLLKKQNLKKKAAIEAWAAKTDAEKLLAYAQEIKDNSTAFIPNRSLGPLLFSHIKILCCPP